MLLAEGSILENVKIAEPYYYRLVIELPKKLNARPGQFLQIKVGLDTTDPLLRRPFSIAGLSRKKVILFYQIKGKGTSILARRLPGERISFLGPLGNGYPILEKRPKVLLAGGIGAASLLFLAGRLALHPVERESCVILGGRSKESLFFLSDFESLGFTVYCATEDGTLGYHGLATSLLKKIAKKIPPSAVLYACGPNPMLRQTSEIVKRTGWKAYFSLETMMACGTGICRGCAILTRTGYRLVCSEGPVFPCEEIVWRENF